MLVDDKHAPPTYDASQTQLQQASQDHGQSASAPGSSGTTFYTSVASESATTHAIPECWLRPIPASATFPLFVPITMASASAKHLSQAEHLSFDRGFYVTHAFGDTPPPPLPMHDVSAEDWDVLWASMRSETRLSGSQRLVAGFGPLAAGLALGVPITVPLELIMKKRMVKDLLELVAAWNTRFFRPRKLDVYITKGEQRMSGPFSDGVLVRVRTASISSSSSSSSDEDSGPEDNIPSGSVPSSKTAKEVRKETKAKRKEAERAAKLERKETKREAKQKRKEGKRERKRVKKAHFVLVMIAPHE